MSDASGLGQAQHAALVVIDIPTLPAIRRHSPDSAGRVEKTAFSCCAADGFCEQLDGLQARQVVLAGMETHICVLQTALELLHRGYDVMVAEDAVCARSRERTRNGLERMRSAGAVISHSESLLFEWMRDAAHPMFKSVSSLLK